MMNIGGLEKIGELVKILDKETIQKFVDGVFTIVDRMTFNISAMQETWNSAKQHDYGDMDPTPDNTPPPYGWVNKEKLRSLNEQMVEAMKVENWEDGFMFAIRMLVLIRAM